MLFDHGLVAKRVLYESSARVPIIISGPPVKALSGLVDQRIAALQDIMPTPLYLSGIEIPDSVTGESLVREPRREYLYGEISEGYLATRMIRKGDWKLIYYPVGNAIQLFNLREDPRERLDRSADESVGKVRDELKNLLIRELYGNDTSWVQDGVLVGVPEKTFTSSQDFTLSGQRGAHWPPPIVQATD